MKGNKNDAFVEKDKILRPLMVDVRDPDRLDAALKKLKRMIKDSRILVELRDHEAFVKPSAKRRAKRMRARARAYQLSMEERGHGF